MKISYELKNYFLTKGFISMLVISLLKNNTGGITMSRSKIADCIQLKIRQKAIYIIFNVRFMIYSQEQK